MSDQTKILGVVFVIVLGLFLFSSCVSVDAGHAGVVSFFGEVDETRHLEPGVHFLNPLARVIEMDCRIQTGTRVHSAASADMQDVTVTLGNNYRLIPDKAPWVYKNVGQDWSERVIPNAESETLKAEIAKHEASDILDKRVQIKKTVQENISTWVNRYGIELTELSISDIDFSENYEDAIEQKQIREQLNLQRAKELDIAMKEAEIAKAVASGKKEATIQEAEGEAQAIIIKAQATADANRALRESLAGEEGTRVLMLQQIQRWNGIMPTTLIGDSKSAGLVLTPVGK